MMRLHCSLLGRWLRRPRWRLRDGALHASQGQPATALPTRSRYPAVPSSSVTGTAESMACAAYVSPGYTRGLNLWGRQGGSDRGRGPSPPRTHASTMYTSSRPIKSRSKPLPWCASRSTTSTRLHASWAAIMRSTASEMSAKTQNPSPCATGSG